MNTRIRKIIYLLMIVSMSLSAWMVGGTPAVVKGQSGPVSFTILHTNDYHGQLEEVLATPYTSSNPGGARLATIIKGVEASVGADNVLLLDAGDEMQGSLLSNVNKGVPTIAMFNQLGYDAATFGNHEFDWGQETLIARTSQAAFPYVSANIVSGTCDAANWTPPSFAAPYIIKTVNTVRVGIIGVTTTETPVITIASSTAGLCFKDPADSILHYYDQVKSQSDVIVVLSHLGYPDGGYGYGIPIYGDQTLATKLNTAGKPVDLIIGGHSHTNLATATKVGTTTVVQAHYNGRKVGRADITVNADHSVTVSWTRLVVQPGNATGSDTPTSEDGTIKDLIGTYASDPAYQELINQEVGWTNVPIIRDYNGDSLMGYFVNDAIYNDLNTDTEPANDVDMVFNNAGGLRADITCAAYPCKLTYGTMFSVLPFGNQTVIGDMTGLQILDLLNQSAILGKGAIQPAGMRYKFYRYLNNSVIYAFGGFDACVLNKSSGLCEPLDLAKTYRVATNEFLAPAGGDNFLAFKDMKNVTYWGDMLLSVNRWVNKTYTAENPYNQALDGRITRDGTDIPDSGSIRPITILHNNDSHGNLAKGAYVGYTQLATLIQQERSYNPDRTLLLAGGDQIQGDAMMYYFKSAPLGYSADGMPLDPALQTHPMMAVMNALHYDAMTLGNHEFNFGSQIFKAVMNQADFPVLGANVTDDGQYGLADANHNTGVQPYIEKDLGGIKVAILGITNHRVPNYELPSNIPGLTFSDPLVKAQELTDQLRATEDVVIALTHIGFTEDPKSVEVDKNVDTNMAAQVSGLDAIIGAHSHTNPMYGFGAYKSLPAVVVGPNNTPVIINQAYRYNNTLGEVVLGVRPKAGGGYEVVSRIGKYLSVTMGGTTEDQAIKDIVNPYVTTLAAYNNTTVGQTTAPIDALQAYTQETTGANLQADAAIHELAIHDITDVDFHLSGAMTNKAVAQSATPANPVTLKVADMFTVMPYENSLVVLSMNGPQLKAVLERAYRNYYYYKYVPGYGGYSYYTTCMIDTNAGGQITYNDLNPALPNGNNVVSLEFSKDGMTQEVDFSDADTYYNVSTVNYLAAGSCNFNDSGVSLWPLGQIQYDTQYYVRDAVINYIQDMEVVSPAVEGRLSFITDTTAPVITINTPADGGSYLHPDTLTLDFSVTDDLAGVRTITADLDGVGVTSGQSIDLHTLALGSHVLTITAVDKAGNESTQQVSFTVTATIDSLKASVNRFYDEGLIDSQDVRDSLLAKLSVSKKKDLKDSLKSFIKLVNTQTGKHIDPGAAGLLITDAQWVLDHPQ